jgi:hypothetical protein
VKKVIEMEEKEFTAKDGIIKAVKQLEFYGYKCNIKEELDLFLAACSPTPASFEKDKINKIEVLLPKKENLVNISIITEEPLDIKKIDEWLRPRIFDVKLGPHFAENRYYEMEFGARNAYSIAAPLTATIIKIRRKILLYK